MDITIVLDKVNNTCDIIKFRPLSFISMNMRNEAISNRVLSKIVKLGSAYSMKEDKHLHANVHMYVKVTC